MTAEFISLRQLSIRLHVEQKTLEHWCAVFGIPREKNKVLSICESTFLTIKTCLREEGMSIAETKERIKP